MNTVWCRLEDVPYCFSRSSVKFQGHAAHKIVDFDTNWVFPDCNFQFEFTDGYGMMHKAWNNIEEVLYSFSRSSIKFQGHTRKNCRFWPKLSVSGQYLLFEFTHGFEMMHIGWCSIEDVPYCFSRSSVKSQDHTRKKCRFWPKLSVSGL